MFLTVLLCVFWCSWLFFSDVLDCSSLTFSGCKRWVTLLPGLFCLPSSLLSSSFYFFKFYFGLFSPYIIHTFIQSLLIISSLPPGGLKKFFLNILGRQVAGRSSDLLGCVCVCAVCVCVDGPFSLPLSLFTLYPFIVFTSSANNYFLLSLQEQHCWRRWAISPSISFTL